MLKCKVFSATKSADREALGDKVTAFIRQTNAKVEKCEVRQSSDSEFHCISIVVFYR